MNRITLLRHVVQSAQRTSSRSLISSSGKRQDVVDTAVIGKQTQAALADKPITKHELIARQVDNDNPFDTVILKPETGLGNSPKKPILVAGSGESRIIGCCCEDDYAEVVWFKLERGKINRCDCGYYFKLLENDPLDGSIKPKFGVGFGSGHSKM